MLFWYFVYHKLEIIHVIPHFICTHGLNSEFLKITKTAKTRSVAQTKPWRYGVFGVIM